MHEFVECMRLVCFDLLVADWVLLQDAARIVKDVYLTEGAGMNFNMMYLGPAIREF